MLKMIYCIRKKEDIASDEFFRYWKKEHGPIVKRYAAAMRIVRYTQNPTLKTPFNDAIREAKGHQEPFDGIAELWWKDIDDLQQAMISVDFTEAQNALFEDEKKFIDFERSCSYFCEEHAVIDDGE